MTLKDRSYALISSFDTAGARYPSGPACAQPYLLEDATSTASLTSGNFYMTTFTADRDISVSNIIVAATTAQTGGTLFRLGLYTVATNDAATLVARTSGVPTDLNATGVVPVSLNTTGGYPANYSIAAGSRYGIGACQVGATTVPSIARKNMQAAPPLGSPIFAFRRSTTVGGANECPATVAASAAPVAQVFWFGLV